VSLAVRARAWTTLRMISLLFLLFVLLFIGTIGVLLGVLFGYRQVIICRLFDLSLSIELRSVAQVPIAARTLRFVHLKPL